MHYKLDVSQSSSSLDNRASTQSFNLNKLKCKQLFNLEMNQLIPGLNRLYADRITVFMGPVKSNDTRFRSGKGNFISNV